VSTACSAGFDKFCWGSKIYATNVSCAETAESIVWDVDLFGPKELCIIWGTDPHGKGHVWTFEGELCQNFPACYRPAFLFIFIFHFSFSLQNLTVHGDGFAAGPSPCRIRFCDEKYPAMQTLVKILWPLVNISILLFQHRYNVVLFYWPFFRFIYSRLPRQAEKRNPPSSRFSREWHCMSIWDRRVTFAHAMKRQLSCCRLQLLS